MTTAIAALPFFGETLSAFDPSDSGIVESTAGGTFDPTWSTCSLSLGPSSTGTSPTWPSASTFWVRYFLNVGNPVSGFPIWVALNMYHAGTIVAQIQYAWGGLGNGWEILTYTLQSGVLTRNANQFAWFPGFNVFDVNIVAGASGIANMYSNGSLSSQNTGLNHTGFAGIDQIQIAAPQFAAGGPAFYSQIMCDSSSTVGRNLRHDRLNTNSAVNTGWTGSVTNINEIPTVDSSPLTSASNGLVSTFFESGLSLGTDNILARGVSARMRKEDNTGPQNIQLAIRSGSSNFFSANIATPNTGFQACFKSWTTDPNTSAAWADAAAASAESGVKSIT